ncbi:MAG TPA: CCA tRNA nucleotidyltransferase, partial [Acidimicrobiales bacterium]|nr:CCA tRNA nucleotidyltransferase [Acidimicrobiales bacterium]
MIPPRLQPIIDETAELARRFEASGHKLYLVGGTVRDSIDARGAKSLDEIDIDLTTDALPDEIESIVGPYADALWLQGKTFGTIGAEKAGRRLEITTHRADVYFPDSRKPAVTFGKDVVTDLSRRDFTVNAMALR